MAKPRTSTVDSDVEMETSPKKKQSSKKQQEEEEEDEAAESEEEGEDEFVVENILKAQRNRGKIEGWAYFIKWAGYDERTWEPEENVISPELLKAFWAGREELKSDDGPEKVNGPKLSTKKKAAPRKSISKDASNSPASTPSKKKAPVKKTVAEDVEEEEEEAPVASSSSKKRKLAEEAEYEEEEKVDEIEAEEDAEEVEPVAAPAAKKAKAAPASATKKKDTNPIELSDSNDEEKEDAPAPVKKKTAAAKAVTKKASTASLKEKSASNGTPKSTKKPAAANGKKSRLSQAARVASPSEGSERLLSPEEDLTDVMSADPKYSKLASWEQVVEKVETVERREEGEGLVVYLRVKGEMSKKRCNIDEAREKLSPKLMDFLLSHLRWKTRSKE